MISLKMYFRFLSFMLIITAFLPVIAENLPITIGSFRFLWAPLWLLSIVMIKWQIIFNRVIFHFLFYGLSLTILIPFVWINMDDWLVKYIIEEFYWMLTIVSVVYYYIEVGDYKGFAQLVKWTLIFIGVTAVLTIIATFINPLYARLLTSASSGFSETSEGKFFMRFGAGTYSFGQALICLFPVLIYFYKQEKKVLYSKWIILLYILLLYLTIIRMQFFANILLASISIIISILGTKRIKISVFIVFFAIVIFVIIPKQFYSNFLYTISKYFAVGSENYNKIIDLAGFIITDDTEMGSAASRLSRYPMLLDAFAKNPMFGNASSLNPSIISPGYHLHWMGKLGATGIFGILLFFYPHVSFLKNWFKKLDNEYSFFAGISFLVFFALGMMKTIAGRDIWFTYFFIIPGMYFLPLLSKDKNFRNK